MKCPCCLTELSGLARYCADCGDYVDDLASTTDATPEARERIPDDRSEAEIRMAIRADLETLGFVVIDFEQGYRPDGSTRVRKGLADLFVMKSGSAAWAEIKSATGRQTKDQREFQADCEACDFPYLLWRSERDAIEWAEGVLAAVVGEL